MFQLRLIVLASLAVTTIYSVPVRGQEAWVMKGTPPSATEAALLRESLQKGQQRIVQFFGKGFPKPFSVEVFPNRDRFDAYFQGRWKLPKTQSWMVASGVSDTLTILSRDVWKTQASEHNPRDDEHYRELIAHEMVHVYHGQFNPTGDFDGMDDLGWLVEGLAVYVSGQLDHSHRQAANEAIRLGKAPTALATAWSGKYRYGVCGSLVRYVDQTWGRDKLKQLLSTTRPEDALKLLGTTEAALLAGWKKSVMLPSK